MFNKEKLELKLIPALIWGKKIKAIAQEGIHLNSSIIIPVMLIKISPCALEKLIQTHWMQCLNPRFPAMTEGTSLSKRG